MNIPERVRNAAKNHSHPLLFATISGAHLYGFPSGDSDWDLRGAHVTAARDVLSLDLPKETIVVEQEEPGFELDLVTHDAAKFFRLLLKNNGYVLEQLYSPLVVVGGDAYDELKEIAKGCITRHHVHHYRGFAHNQWALFQKDDAPRLKPLLYVYRVLLTGIHLMRTGVVEANLETLLGDYPLAHVPDLIARKRAGAEKEPLPSGDTAVHAASFESLMERLVGEAALSGLPETPSARGALSDLLVRLRLESLNS